MRTRVGLAREVFLVAIAILLYFGIRNLSAGDAGAAFANAHRILRFERALGIDWEESLQDAASTWDGLITLANWVYIWGHWPVILATAVALLLFHRDQYLVFRNALFISGVVGFLFFAFFPVAPPRLLDIGLVDTVSEQSNSYRALQPAGLTNQYAAFPSLHAGWNLVVGIILIRASSHLAVRSFGAISPLAMALAVVVTANHFVVDVAGGYAVVLVGLAGALLLERRALARDARAPRSAET